METRYSPDGTVSQSTAPNGMAGPRRESLAGMPEGGSVEVREPETGVTLVAFHSGWGDGAYPAWAGCGADGEVVCFVADLLVLRDAVVAREAPVA